jgi:hypothetical protein
MGYAEMERRRYDDSEFTFLRINGVHPANGGAN